MKHRIAKLFKGMVMLWLLWLTAPLNAQPKHDWQWATRARMAHLEQGEQSGKAASVLLRGDVESSWSRKFSTFAQVDYTATTWRDAHSDGVRLNGAPPLPDVPGADLNQAFAAYKGDAWRARLGRQRIVLDDQRFVGGNGFWQNEQTFDALRLEQRWWSASRLHYVYIANANRIHGEKAHKSNTRPAGFWGDHQHHTHLLHLEVNEWDAARWHLFFYDIDNRDLPALTNRTFGGKYTHTWVAGDWKTSGNLAWATQTRAELPGAPKPQYHLAELSALRQAWRGVLRHEVLGSDKTAAFVTPLASAHDFQGWADVFVAPPAAGVADSSAQLQWRASPWELEVRYHYFTQAQGDAALGEEWDLELEFKPARQHLWSLRYANFRTKANTLLDVQRLFLNYSYAL